MNLADALGDLVDRLPVDGDKAELRQRVMDAATELDLRTRSARIQCGAINARVDALVTAPVTVTEKKPPLWSLRRWRPAREDD